MVSLQWPFFEPLNCLTSEGSGKWQKWLYVRETGAKRAVTIDWLDDVETVNQFSDDELAEHIRLMEVLKMFELGEISSGQATELTGLTRAEFFEVCGRYRVPIINIPPDVIATTLRQDLQSAREASL